MYGTSLRENREIHGWPVAEGATGRIGKAGGRTPMTDDPWKSDRLVVPAKSSNKTDVEVAETAEGRSLAQGNTDEQNAPRTQSRTVDVPSALDRVREAARRDRKQKFTALFHHITVDLLRESFQGLHRKA